MLVRKIQFLALFSSLVFFTSCDNEFENPVDEVEITSGSADFSKYVAIGNSLTAGFADNALYTSAQMNSYPNILAESMMAAGGGEFTQPLMPDDIGGWTDINGLPGTAVDGKLVLEAATFPAPQSSTPQSSFSFINGNYGNLGVPGAKSFHLLYDGYGNPNNIISGLANPYFVRMATSFDATVLGDAAVQSPTFFSLWIGNNDVLAYATSGGSGVDQTGNLDPFTYGFNDITDPAVVSSVIQTAVETLTANGAKGAIANIPYVTSIPFFTTVDYDVIGLGEVEVAQLSPIVEAHNAVIGIALQQGIISEQEAASRLLSVEVGPNNPVLIADNDLTDLQQFMFNALTGAPFNLPPQDAGAIALVLKQAKQADEGDLILLTAQGLLGQPIDPTTGDVVQNSQFIGGVNFPLPDRFVLDAQEQSNIRTAVDAYNASILSIAQQYDLAFVDANIRLTELESGISFNGTDYSADFITGGAFSLDGVHPNARGYAIVANFFIEAINNKYGSNLRQVNPNDYPGIQIP